MTGKQLLKELKTQFEVSDLLSERICLADILDCLAVIGLDGASDAYLRRLEKTRPKQNVRPKQEKRGVGKLAIH